MYKNHYDVIVAGGGTAGIAAGLCAAREGAGVLLIEKNAYVGGTAASGLPFIDFFNSNGEQVVNGIAEELVEVLMSESSCIGHIKTHGGHLNSITMIDPEWVKIKGEEMLLASGCDIMYHSFVCGAEIEDNQLKAVKIANKNGISKITAKCFIDTTGDGDLFKFAGAAYEKGRQSDGLCQAMSLLFRLGNVDVEKLSSQFPEEIPIVAKPMGSDHAYNLHISGKLSAWNDVLVSEDIFPNQNHNIWAGTMRDNELTYVNTVRVVEKDGSDAYELSKAEIEGRRQMKKMVSFMKDNLPGMEKAYISSVPNGIGVRETLRLKGVYMLTGEDVIHGRKFGDAIARNCYVVDIHDPKGKKWGYSRIQSEDQQYDIPYRCLIPETLNGLLVAGRCISTTAEALASTRIMTSCMALGQAAGTAAALAVKHDVQPRNVDVCKLQERLKAVGVII